MWIMLNDAFISIVDKDCAPDELMVRARRPGDIERLFPETEGTVKPFTGSDYHYRAPVKRGKIAAALSRCVADIGYSNFKDSVKDRPLHDAYLRVWHAMASLQPEAPYSGRQRRRSMFDAATAPDLHRALHDMPSDRDLDRLTPFEEAHVFATGRMPDEDFTPASAKAKSRKPAKKNMRGR